MEFRYNNTHLFCLDIVAGFYIDVVASLLVDLATLIRISAEVGLSIFPLCHIFPLFGLTVV